MHIIIPSKFDAKQIYLETDISVEDDMGMSVPNVLSPLSRVDSYYKKNIEGDFDFSFFDENGFHSITGNKGEQVRNLLVLLSYEHTFYNRNIVFHFSNERLNDVTQNNELNNGLVNNTLQTLERLSFMPKNEFFWIEFGIWLYFKLQNYLFNNEIDKVRFIINNVCFSNFIDIIKTIYHVDPKFVTRFSIKITHQELRKFLISDKFENRKNIVVLGAFRPKNIASNLPLQEAARRVVNQQNARLSEEIKLKITNIINNDIDNAEPNYLPIITDKSPENIAQQILKYYDFSLPSWNVILNDLGTVLIRHNLGNDFLGLFVSNPDAHQSAIIINTYLRHEGSHNFTIAHELGHYLLHNNESFLCADQEIYYPQNNQLIEQQANTFSIELLMPIQRIRDYLGVAFSAQNVQRIASISTHKVSMEAAARRRIQVDKKRKLAFISILNDKVVSIAATEIKADGTRWIGKNSIGSVAVSSTDALKLYKSREKKLSRYFPAAGADWLQDLDIHIHPFGYSNGYYLFIELA